MHIPQSVAVRVIVYCPQRHGPSHVSGGSAGIHPDPQTAASSHATWNQTPANFSAIATSNYDQSHAHAGLAPPVPQHYQARASAAPEALAHRSDGWSAQATRLGFVMLLAHRRDRFGELLVWVPDGKHRDADQGEGQRGAPLTGSSRFPARTLSHTVYLMHWQLPPPYQ